MNQFDHSDCLELSLPSSEICQGCSIFRSQLLENPRRKRRSKCRHPWKVDLSKGKIQQPKLDTAIKCWDFFVSKGIANTVPKELEDKVQSSKKRASASTPSKKKHSPENAHPKKATRFFSPEALGKRPTKEKKKGSTRETRTKNDEKATHPLVGNFLDSFNSMNLNNNFIFSCGNTIQQTDHGDNHRKSAAVRGEVSEREELENTIEHLRVALENEEQKNAQLKFALSEEEKKSSRLLSYIQTLKKDQLDDANYVFVHRSQHALNETAREQMTRLMNILRKGKADTSNKMSRRILGEIVATHPSISFETAAEIIALSRAQLMADAGLLHKISYQNIAHSSPTGQTLGNILNETTADILFSLHLRIFHHDAVDGEFPSVFFSCDKGTSGNFVKVVSWYSKSSKKVEQVILDVDVSYGTSQECAEAM